ncbi:MAG: hypothetical protein AABX08_01650 [Nanoarchaeota archaeon]
MKNKPDVYKRIREDLIREIELCEVYKEQIRQGIAKINDEYRSGFIDKGAYYSKVKEFLKGKNVEEWIGIYDARIVECHKNIGYYDSKIDELTEKNQGKEHSFSKIFLAIGIISLILGLVFFVRPTITGLFSLEAEPKVVFEDGYGREGFQWMEINGLRVYERCLKVQTDVEFDDMAIIAKITRATDNNDLRFRLYGHNDVDDEPDKLISSCRVKNYDSVWKSCAINEIEQEAGEYWICAAYLGGESDETYYTIAYQNGDLRRTALWTGENWQKLDGASYSMKAQFKKNE